MNVRTYSPRDGFLLAIGGLPIAEWVECRVRRNAPRSTTTVSTDGAPMRVLSADATGTAELVMMQTAPDNARLSRLAAIDGATGRGITPFRLVEGATVIGASQCWVQKEADADYAGTAKERTWTIALANVEPFMIGGNPS